MPEVLLDTRREFLLDRAGTQGMLLCMILLWVGRSKRYIEAKEEIV